MKIRLAVFAAVLTGVAAGAAAVPLTPTTPTPASSPAAEARKQVVAAQANVLTARKALLAARTKVEQPFKSQPAWVKAQKDLDKAQSDYTAVKQVALDGRRAKPDYQATLAAKQNADAKLKEAQVAGVSPKDQDEIAQEIANQGIALKRMENEALESDARVAQAKTKQTEAMAQLEVLKRQVDDTAKADPEYMAAEQTVSAAEQQVLQAQQSLAQVVKSEADARAAAAKAKAQATRPPSSTGGGRR